MTEPLRIGMLAPIAWSTPPQHYGPWEQVVATLAAELVAQGVDVTLYATGDSLTAARLVSVVEHGYEIDRSYDVKVFEALHIARCFEDAAAGRLDLVHNHFDFLPLAWTRVVATPVVTTIHGFSSPAILPAYRAYDRDVAYVSISDADRDPSLRYAATIHHGLDLTQFPFQATPDADGHLAFLGRLDPEKAPHVAIDIARASGRAIVLAGIITDEDYVRTHVRPRLGPDAEYVGPVGPTERAALLGAATAVLHPVAFDEPFGLSVVESMACGTPVVATPRGSMPELIRPGVNGELAGDLTAAIAAVDRAAEIDRRGCRDDAETRFSAARMAADYLRLYRRLARRGGRSSSRHGRRAPAPASGP